MKIQISNFAGICPKSLPRVLSKAKLWSHFDQPIPFCQGAWMLQFANTWHQTCYILCAGDPGDPWCILDCDDMWWRKKLSEVPNQRHFIASIFNFSSASPFAGGFTDVLWWTHFIAGRLNCPNHIQLRSQSRNESGNDLPTKRWNIMESKE